MTSTVRVRLPIVIAACALVAASVTACSGSTDDGTAQAPPGSASATASVPTGGDDFPDTSIRQSTGLPPSTLPDVPNPVTAVDFLFDPVEITVDRGAIVTWINAEPDAVDHWIVANETDLFDSGSMRPGNRYAFAFDVEPGRYDYFCNIHNSMRGAVVVR
jgi:plastocyanin